MRNVWGTVCALAVVSLAGCASQSGSQQQASTTPAESEQAQTSAVDPSSISPERQDAIERTFQRKAAELQDCWSKEYDKTHDRKLEGDLTLGMDVQPSGSVSNVRVLKSSLSNQDIESCVVKEVTGWSFPEGRSTVPYMRTVHLGAQF